MGIIYFGGYDPAKRVDKAAFVLLAYEEGVLTQAGQKVWDNINYKDQADDLQKIQKKYRMTKMCYDRTGVGDAAAELFSREVPLEEVVTSLPKKIEMINFLHSLFQNKKLIIKDKELYDQLMEQEQHITEAGNIQYKHPTSKHDDVFWALAYACYAAKGLIMGLPTYTLGRIGRNTKEGLLHKVDRDIIDELGPGWHVQSY